jgi:hypothetical protein
MSDMSTSSNKSSKETEVDNLANITVPIAQRFLTELANLSDDSSAMARFDKRFGSLIRSEIPMYVVGSWAAEERAERDLADEEMIQKYWLSYFKEAVRRVWLLPDLRSKRWYVHRILTKFVFGDSRESYTDLVQGPLGPPSRLERILEELVRSNDSACHCRNSYCPAPFFFATRRGQKYCSEACAEPAQREAKQKWWSEHGKDWRDQRKGTRKQQGKKSFTTIKNRRSKDEKTKKGK